MSSYWMNIAWLAAAASDKLGIWVLLTTVAVTMLVLWILARFGVIEHTSLRSRLLDLGIGVVAAAVLWLGFFGYNLVYFPSKLAADSKEELRKHDSDAAVEIAALKKAVDDGNAEIEILKDTPTKVDRSGEQTLRAQNLNLQS